MDKQINHIISILDAIAFTREIDPRILKQMARDALSDFNTTQWKEILYFLDFVLANSSVSGNKALVGGIETSDPRIVRIIEAAQRKS